MLTFQDQYEMAQQITNNYSSDQLVVFKRDINEGGAMFLNRLGRKFNRQYKTANLEDGKQYYQFPADVIRISEVSCVSGSFVYHPELVTSEEEWILLNQVNITGNYPTHYFIRGFNEVGLYPIPSADVTNGITVSYEPQLVELTQDDIVGNITVTNDSITITGSGFTPQMVGRMFQVTDGTDGNWYRISAYVSGSSLQLENYFQGITGTRASRIGQAMNIPQAYQDAPVYYAVDRYYLTKNDQASALQFSKRFDMKIKSAKETYGRSTSRMGVKSRRIRKYRPWSDAPPAITYP